MDKLRISAIEGRAAIPDYYRSEPARTDITYLVGRVKELEFQVSGNERAHVAEIRQLQAIITALTQDRAAVLPEGFSIRHRLDRGDLCVERNGAEIVRAVYGSSFWDFLTSFKTPPTTQAEPKRYWRRHANGGTTLTPDTRNPAEADRRKSDKGYQARPPHERSSSRGGHTYYGRRAGDAEQWFGKEAAFTTPTPQRATEVSLMDALINAVKTSTGDKLLRDGMTAWELTARILGDELARRNELDKRERGS